MKLTIMNFASENTKEWLFQLKDGKENIYYIMHEIFYKHNGLKSPVDKHILDLPNGVTIEADTVTIEKINIVTKINAIL